MGSTSRYCQLFNALLGMDLTLRVSKWALHTPVVQKMVIGGTRTK